MEPYAQTKRLPVRLRHVVVGFDGTILRFLFVRRASAAWSWVQGYLPANEHLEQAALRILMDQTGLRGPLHEQLYTSQETDGASAHRTVLITYLVLCPITTQTRSLVQKHRADWFSLRQLPRLNKEPETLIRQVLDQLRRRAAALPSGFALLPTYFNLPQVIRLYSALFDRPIEPGAFTRQLLATNLLLPVQPRPGETGPALYRMDWTAYANPLMSDWQLEFLSPDFLR